MTVYVTHLQCECALTEAPKVGELTHGKKKIKNLLGLGLGLT